MNKPAQEAAEQRLRALTWLKTHYPELVDAYWSGDTGVVRAGMLRLVETLCAIHNAELPTAAYLKNSSAYHEYTATGDVSGNEDAAMSIGHMLEAQEVMEHFGCTCQPKEDQ